MMPAAVLELVSTLRAERVPLADKVDAIDLVIANLERLYPVVIPDVTPVVGTVRTSGWSSGSRRRKAAKRTKRRAKPARIPPVKAEAVSEAEGRRVAMLEAIAKAPHGLTMAEFRKLWPKWKRGDIANAAQQLKAAGKIRRAGNAWELVH